ncbi:MAG: nucleotidyltransferase family protein [Nitrososphaerales archaeon]
MKTKALILAGGMGTRLQPYTFFVPKPMLPLADRPLLEHLIVWLKSNKIEEIVISVSYLRHMIEDYFEDGKRWQLKIAYASSESPLGISGQILAGKSQIKSTFVLLYGDSAFDFDLKRMQAFHKKSNAKLTIGLMHYSEKMKYGLIERDEKTGVVLSWKEKPEIGGLINVGCYIAEPALFDYIPKGKMYGFDKVVRDMMKGGEKVVSYVIEGKEFNDIGDEKSYKKAYDLYMQKLGKIL